MAGTGTGPAPLTADQAEAVAAAITALDPVAGLDGGRFGEVALLFPGRRVTGLREAAGRLAAHVRLRVAGPGDGDLRPRLDEVRAAARGALGPGDDRPIDVVLADVTGGEGRPDNDGGK